MRNVISLKAPRESGFVWAAPRRRHDPAFWAAPVSAQAISAAVSLLAILAVAATFLVTRRDQQEPSLLDSMTLTVVSGVAEVRPVGSASFVPAHDGQTLHAGDVVQTAEDSRVMITYFEGASAVIGPATTSVVTGLATSPAKQSVVAFSADPHASGRYRPDDPVANDGAWQRLTHALSQGVATL